MDTDIRVLELSLSFREDRLRTPLKFGSVVVESSESLIVRARVQNRLGQAGEGFGAMPLGDQWAFPSRLVPHEKRLEGMRRIAQRFSEALEADGGFGHPMDIYFAAKRGLMDIAGGVDQDLGFEEPMPVLGALVSVSPVDAALHDAFGRVNGVCSYEGYGPRFMGHDLSRYLGERFRGRYVSDYIRQAYAPRLPVFHLVGGLDKLRGEEVDAGDPEDGLPVSLDGWIERDGIFCFKVKLRGNDVDWDVARTKAVAEVAHETLARMGRREFYLSADSNEMHEGPGSVVEYLRKLRKASPMAFDRLLYLEQPTERDLAAHKFDMREVARIKPVFADEGVTDLEGFDTALRLGWSGVALKTCKGHSSALLYAAKSEEYGVPYTVQDLTCPGLALVHSAGLAARINPLKGFEYNARQYLPHAFREVQQRHQDVFTVRDGTIGTSTLAGTGLGL